MDGKIPVLPALTPEEWAAGKVVFKIRSKYDEYGLELPSARERSAEWSGDDRSALIVFDGSWAAPIREPHRMAAAAFCLHGRISWADVDALRDAAKPLQRLSCKPVFPVGHEFGGDHEMVRQITGVVGKIGRQGDRLMALADLLESLLPPRETP